MALLYPACTSGAQARLAYGGAPAELQRLHDEGWLEAFRSRECRPMYLDEPVEEAPRPLSGGDLAADAERERVLRAEFAGASETAAPTRADPGAHPSREPLIQELASVGQGPRGARSPECRSAALRLRALQQEYLSASGVELLETHRAVADLAPTTTTGEEPCPNDDETLFGAELAVARYLNVMQTEPGVVYGFAEQSCALPTLAGPLPVRVEASEEETGPGGFDHYALDGVVQRCVSGVEGYEDGCVRERWGSGCDPSCEPEQDRCCSLPYAEFVSHDAGTVTIVIGLSRAAMGCGSTGLRAYYVRRESGIWRVVREVIIGYGNHGV